MKNTIKTVISIILVGIFTLAAAIPAFAGLSDGWHDNEYGWFYTIKNEMQREKLKDDSVGTCYLDENGYVAYDKPFILYDAFGSPYFYGYAGPDGHIYKNKWALFDGDWYYFKSDGNLATEEWIKDSKGWCYVNEYSIMLRARSVKDSKGWCLLDENGYWVTKPGWNKVSYQDGLVTRTDWYYVEKNGYLKTDAWMKDSVGWCYLDADGAVATCTSVKDSKGWCLLDENGRWVTKPGWQSVTFTYSNGSTYESWFYVENSGYLRTNAWAKDSKGWCYVGKYGWTVSGMLVKDGTGYCFIGDDGYWATKAGVHFFREYVSPDEGTKKRYCLVGSDGYVKVSESESFGIPDLSSYKMADHSIMMGQFKTDSRGVLSSVISTSKMTVEPPAYISYKTHYSIFDDNPTLFGDY